MQTTSGGPSPRSRGVKQGLFMFLLMFVVAPIVGLISAFGLGIEPWPVGIVVTLLGLGGILRIVYALMFEPKHSVAIPENRTSGQLNPAVTSALPPVRDMAAADYVSPSSEPADVVTNRPGSVTEGTTRLLDKDR